MFVRDSGIIDIYIAHNKCVEWRNKILKRSSAGNCNNYHGHMKSLFNLAVKEGCLDTNVFKSIDFLKTNNTKRKTISQATLDKLLTVIKYDKYYSYYVWFYLAMISVFIFTAIRCKRLELPNIKATSSNTIIFFTDSSP